MNRAPDYWDPGTFELERKKIFERGWFLAGHESEWAEAGDYKVLPFPGKSVAVVRQGDGSLKALANNCLHRQTALLAGERGRADNPFSCSYHGWRYALDGKLKHVPEAGGLSEPLEKSALEEFALERAGGLVWVSLASSLAPFASFIKDLAPIFSAFDLAAFEPSRARSFELAVNWKAVLENACEAYHIRTVHKNSVGRIDNQGELKIKDMPPHCLLTIPLGKGGFKRLLDRLCVPAAPALPEFEREHYHKLVITPNTILNITPLFFTVYQAWPNGAGASTLRYAFFARRGLNPLARLRLLATYLGSRWILREDLGILARFQDGQRFNTKEHVLHEREHAVDFLRREWDKSLA